MRIPDIDSNPVANMKKLNEAKPMVQPNRIFLLRYWRTSSVTPTWILAIFLVKSVDTNNRSMNNVGLKSRQKKSKKIHGCVAASQRLLKTYSLIPMCFQKSRIGGAFLQGRFFQSLSKKFVIIAGSGIFSLRKAGFGNCKSSWRGVCGEAFFQEGSPQYYFFDHALVSAGWFVFTHRSGNVAPIRMTS